MNSEGGGRESVDCPWCLVDGQLESVDGRGHASMEDRHDGRTKKAWMDMDKSAVRMDGRGQIPFVHGQRWTCKISGIRFVICIGAVWASGMMLRRDAAVTPLHDTSGIAKVVGSLRIASKNEIVLLRNSLTN